jgi:hypothetical protein
LYTDWKDGGIGFHQLEERKKVLASTTFCHLFCSNSEDIRDLSNDVLGRDIQRYRIDISEENEDFLNWLNPDKIHVCYNNSSFVMRAFKCALKLKIGIRLTEDRKVILKDLFYSNNNCAEVHTKKISQTISRFLYKRHYSELCKLKSKGQLLKICENYTFNNFLLTTANAIPPVKLLDLRLREDAIVFRSMRY